MVLTYFSLKLPKHFYVVLINLRFSDRKVNYYSANKTVYKKMIFCHKINKIFSSCQLDLGTHTVFSCALFSTLLRLLLFPSY